MTGLERLVADAKAAYSSGKLKPIREAFFTDGCGCGIIAAYVEATQCPVNVDYFVAVRKRMMFTEWAQQHYGLTYDEVWDFIRGFDGDYPVPSSRPAYLAGVALAREVF